MPTFTGGPGANIASSISQTSGGLTGLIAGGNASAQEQARNLLYYLSGSVNSGSQLYWIDDASDVQNAHWENFLTFERKYRDQVLNEASIFAKDDWKISPSLTLNLGLRWEYYGVPFIGSGFTTAAPGLGLGLFGVGRQTLGNTNPLINGWLHRAVSSSAVTGRLVRCNATRVRQAE
jgi:outer membrane receptor protein involved in Fe transport